MEVELSGRLAPGGNLYNLCVRLAAGLIWLLSALPATSAESDIQESDAKQASSETIAGWKKKWAVEEGFSLSLDTEGYHYPTAIAFVPEPGDGPKDPLYFVTELRGKVKVVTNDRTVHTFAEGFLQTEFYEECPRATEEFGLAGICLEPSRGYVFVTFAYQNDNEALYNNIIRFETTPKTFALKPDSQQAFTEVFAPYESGVFHQIGGCQISNDMLYVGVGDGMNWPRDSQNMELEAGEHNGQPESIAANGDYVFSEAIGPAQMDYYQPALACLIDLHGSIQGSVLCRANEHENRCWHHAYSLQREGSIIGVPTVFSLLRALTARQRQSWCGNKTEL